MDERMPPVVELEPPPPTTTVNTNRYKHGSIATLLVVLAVITIIGVFAGIIARLCGGRHFGGNGENDIEGWVEKRCKSCLDGGVPAPEQPKPPEETKAATEEAKK